MWLLHGGGHYYRDEDRMFPNESTRRCDQQFGRAVCRLLLASMAVVASAHDGAAFPAAAQRVAAGLWGGDHVRLVIAAKGARPEFDCATGGSDEPITVRADGRGEAAGSSAPERGGPRRGDAVVGRAR